MCRSKEKEGERLVQGLIYQMIRGKKKKKKKRTRITGLLVDHTHYHGSVTHEKKKRGEKDVSKDLVRRPTRGEERGRDDSARSAGIYSTICCTPYMCRERKKGEKNHSEPDVKLFDKPGTSKGEEEKEESSLPRRPQLAGDPQSSKKEKREEGPVGNSGARCGNPWTQGKKKEGKREETLCLPSLLPAISRR